MKSLLIPLLTLLALAASLLVPQDAHAFRFRCHRTGAVYSAPVARHVADTKVEVVVVNNLVGIPTPVAYNQPLAAQGETVYGYGDPLSLSQFTGSYGAVDMAVLYNQANRLVAQAQSLSSQASGDFMALVQQEGRNQTEVASILAQGITTRQNIEAAEQVIRAASPQIASRQTTIRLSRTAEGQWQVQEEQEEAAVSPAIAGDFTAVMANKCASCHGPNKKAGGLDVTGGLSLAQLEKIAERVTSHDEDKFMPRGADGGPGEPLTFAEKLAVIDRLREASPGR